MLKYTDLLIEKICAYSDDFYTKFILENDARIMLMVQQNYKKITGKNFYMRTDLQIDWYSYNIIKLANAHFYNTDESNKPQGKCSRGNLI